MDDWLAIPRDRKALPARRLCVILALTVLLLVVVQGRAGIHPQRETPVSINP